MSSFEKEGKKLNDTFDQFGSWLRADKGNKQRGKNLRGPKLMNPPNRAEQNIEEPLRIVMLEEDQEQEENQGTRSGIFIRILENCIP